MYLEEFFIHLVLLLLKQKYLTNVHPIFLFYIEFLNKWSDLLYVLDTKSLMWTKYEPKKGILWPPARSHASFGALDDRYVALFGGDQSAAACGNDLWMYLCFSSSLHSPLNITV